MAAVLALGGPAQATTFVDPTFGTDGSVTTDFGGTSDQVIVMAVQPDGKILVGGTSSPTASTQTSIVKIVRYDADGTVDTTFASQGQLTISYPGESYATIDSMAVQLNGRILVSTRAFSWTQGYFAAVSRLMPDGTLDPNFSGDGKIAGWFGQIGVQSNGRILVFGAKVDNSQQGLVAFHPNGSIDHTFGRDGFAKTPSPGGETLFRLDLLSVSPSDRILLGGNYGSALAAAEVTRNGFLRTGFGDHGLATLDPGGYQTLAYDVGPGLDGGVVVGGSSQDSVPKPRVEGDLVRFTNTGAPDAGFGTGGLVRRTVPAYTGVVSFATDANGRTVVGLQNSSPNRDFLLARYGLDGSLDQSFGDMGVINAQLGTNGGSVWPVVIQPDGNILAAGWLSNGSDQDFAVVRFLLT
ncbi:MAG: delta-60 repeat domain-containing protein [Actinomycetota bacterium]